MFKKFIKIIKSILHTKSPFVGGSFPEKGEQGVYYFGKFNNGPSTISVSSSGNVTGTVNTTGTYTVVVGATDGKSPVVLPSNDIVKTSCIENNVTKIVFELPNPGTIGVIYGFKEPDGWTNYFEWNSQTASYDKIEVPRDVEESKPFNS